MRNIYIIFFIGFFANIALCMEKSYNPGEHGDKNKGSIAIQQKCEKCYKSFLENKGNLDLIDYKNLFSHHEEPYCLQYFNPSVIEEIRIASIDYANKESASENFRMALLNLFITGARGFSIKNPLFIVSEKGEKSFLSLNEKGMEELHAQVGKDAIQWALKNNNIHQFLFNKDPAGGRLGFWVYGDYKKKIEELRGEDKDFRSELDSLIKQGSPKAEEAADLIMKNIQENNKDGMYAREIFFMSVLPDSLHGGFYPLIRMPLMKRINSELNMDILKEYISDIIVLSKNLNEKASQNLLENVNYQGDIKDIVKRAKDKLNID